MKPLAIYFSPYFPPETLSNRAQRTLSLASLPPLLHLSSFHITLLSESHLKELQPLYLQGLQVTLLWIAEQRGDAVVVPHTADVGVPPQREDLTDDGHSAQGAVNQLHDVGVAHLLQVDGGGHDQAKWLVSGLVTSTVLLFLIFLSRLINKTIYISIHPFIWKPSWIITFIALTCFT